MMWEQEILLEYQRRRTKTINMRGKAEDMTYGEEGVHAAAVAAERIYKYHGNDDQSGDKNDEYEGETKFEEDDNDGGMGDQY